MSDVQQRVKCGDLVLDIESSSPPQSVKVAWHGKANERHPGEFLNPLLDQVLADARRQGSNLEFHLEPLEHINSSTVMLLMQFIRSLKDTGVRMVLVYDGDTKWQRLTFEVLHQLDSPAGVLELHPV